MHKSLLSGLILSAMACSPPPPPAPNADDVAKRVNVLADRYVKEYFDAFPYQTVTAGAPDAHPDQLVDHSLPALQQWQSHEDAMLTDLKAIDPAPIDGRAEGVTYKFLQNQLESSQKFRVCRMELWNVSPTYTGW